MKILTAFFLISAGLAYGQAPGKMITFNKADTEHCKVVAVKGMPLLQSTYDGITVAIAMPMNRGNGDFSIFVVVSQTGAPPFQVNPKDFYALFSDQAHTRFEFHDTSATRMWRGIHRAQMGDCPLQAHKWIPAPSGPARWA